MPELKLFKEGQQAARFRATYSGKDDSGWAFQGRALQRELDLSSMDALRVWVHGDNNGAKLKIQFLDDNMLSNPGVWDIYIPIDYEGWKEHIINFEATSTLNRSKVKELNFYYNGLRANSTADCVIDAVRAVMGNNEVMLEDFEDPYSTYWEHKRHQIETYKQYGIEPAGFGLVAAPTASITKAIQSFEVAAGLPSPRPGGNWGKESEESRKSYLFLTDLTESQASGAVHWAKRGNFGAVLILGWFKTGGHYEINNSKFPTGIASLKNTISKIKSEGLRAGLHFLAPSVDLHDKYVTPAVDKRLVKDAWAELASGVTENATFLPTTTVPVGFPTQDPGADKGTGMYLQVGDEIIEYEGISSSPPGFKIKEPPGGRGALGTSASAHAKADKVGHLLRSYGYFLFDLDTDLAKEVTDRVANVLNDSGANMMYMDGSEWLQGEHWYYNAKLQKLYYDALKDRDTFVQGSSYSHFSWHIHSRYASADGHEDVKRYLNERMVGFNTYKGNLMPLDIGWYYLNDPKVTEDQFEYILQKSLAFDASISLETSLSSLTEHPVSERVIDLIAAYEKLRLSSKVPQSARKLLQEKGREYRLLTEPTRFRRVHFVNAGGKNDGDWRRITALDGVQNVFNVKPVMEGCKLGMQVRCDSDVGSGYNDGPMLYNFDSVSGYDMHSNYEDVTSTLTEQKSECATWFSNQCTKFTATSKRTDNVGWAHFGKRLSDPIDLSNVLGFGVWIKGDGKGGIFKLQFSDEIVLQALDFEITNDFYGWRYVQLVRPANQVFTATRINLYYNAMPANSTLTCFIDEMKLLSALNAPRVVNPSITVAGKQPVTINTTVSRGERLIYYPTGPVQLIGATRENKKVVPVMPTNSIDLTGEMSITFSADQSAFYGPVEVRIVQDCLEELAIP